MQEDIVADEDILEDEGILEDEETLEDESDEEEEYLIQTIEGLTKVDRLCEELSFPNYTNLENALRSCCGISSSRFSITFRIRHKRRSFKT